MLHGYLDALLSSGFFVGWAIDVERPWAPLEIAIVDEKDVELASGLANRHRQDLAAAAIGTGWCSFLLRADAPVSRLRNSTVRLIDRKTGTVVADAQKPRYAEGEAHALVSLAEVVANDPTTVASIDMLEGCGALFDAFLKALGVAAFVRAAYIYVLQRPADPGGLAHYGKLLRQGALTPYALIAELASSGEFKSRPRLLVAPTMPGFPFLSV